MAWAKPMPLMLSPAAVVPDSKLRLVIIVFSIPRWSSPWCPVSDVRIPAFGENLLPICSL